MLTFTSRSAAETLAFGRELGIRLKAGDIICMTGDLGAGKTLLTQGIAAALGVSDDVTSPTFTILQIYETGRLDLCHFDLYRLDDAAELEDIGFYEYTGVNGVAIIEWADKFAASMPDECLRIEIIRGAGEDDRSISLIPRGARYRSLCEELSRFADTCS